MSQFAPARPRPLDTPVSITVVASMYNNQFVQGLVNAVAAELEDLAPQATVDVYRVPGAFEIPVTTELVLRNSQPDAIIALGVFIRGSTQHADLVGSSVTQAVQDMAVRHCTPIVHEVLLVDDAEQAEERCLGATINRGTEAARVCVQMINLFAKMRAGFAGETELA